MKLTIRIVQQDVWQVLIKSSRHEQKLSTDILKRWPRCVCKACERSPADKSGLRQVVAHSSLGGTTALVVDSGHLFGLSCILIKGIGVFFVLNSFTLAIKKLCYNTEKGLHFPFYHSDPFKFGTDHATKTNEFSENFQRGRWVIFNPKNYIAGFGLL